MNYGNPSISLIPLSKCESIKISYDDDTYTIPNEKMLRELTIMPVPDLILITNILRQYGATKRQEKEVSRIIEHTNYADEDWFLKIVDKLIDDNCDSKLILRLSLENYRIQQPFDTNSHLTFKKMSDVVIRNIRSEDKIPLAINRVVKEFLDKKEISNRELLKNISLSEAMDYAFKYFFDNGEDLSHVSYRRFHYHKLVLNYFDDVAPFRITHTANIDKDRIFNNFLQEFYQQMMENDGKKIPGFSISFNKKQQEYHERIRDSYRRKMILFTDYYKAKLYTAHIYQLLAQECPEFIALQIEWNDRVRKSNERKSERKNLKRQMLCLCEFCYRFRWFEKVKGGAVAWHCKETECEERYRAWLNYLGSRDIRITSYSR